MDKSHGMAASSRPINAPQSRSFAGMFGRMFRELPAWEPDGATETGKLASILKIAAEMEEKIDTPKGDIDAIDGVPRIPAAYTFFGQFVDHDITFDPRSSLQKANDPDNLEDFRTPAFDLDNIYGRGPDDQPYLYRREKHRKSLVLGEAKSANDDKIKPVKDADLPRSADGTAIIGDMRNDENLLVSQLQLVFLKFHNKIVADLAAKGMPDDRIFAEAQRLARWHYQWVVIHDWLDRLCGSQIIHEILDIEGEGRFGRPKLMFYHFKEYPFMPVEFSVAAYRLGHSMMRNRYRIKDNRELPLFDLGKDDDSGEDLRGFQHIEPKNTVEWCHLLAFAGKDKAKVQASRKIDKFLCSPVIHMPDRVANPDDVAEPPVPPPEPIDDSRRSLAFRNLLRAYRLGLPSGQSVARRIGVKTNDILPGNTPLWRYMLDEASKFGKGNQLGPVGCRITAEVFIGLLAADPTSFYGTNSTWTPATDPVLTIKPQDPKDPRAFQLRDIIAYAAPESI